MNDSTRCEFDVDALAHPGQPLDAATAWKLVRTARFGIALSQDPLAELSHYAERIANLCLHTTLDPEAFAAFESLLDNGMRPQSDDPFVHTVKKGETLRGLAERYGGTVASLVGANPFTLRKRRSLSSGLRLLMPDNLTYVTRPGDTLESISESLSEYVRCFDDAAAVLPEELRRRNQLPSDEDLAAGQALAFGLPRLV